MKLTRVLLVLGVLLLAVGFVGIPSAIQADGGGAWVEVGVACGLDAATSGLDISLWTEDSHTVVTPSGNWKLTCHFMIPEGYVPMMTLHNAGFVCGIYGGPNGNQWTEDSQSVASTDGTALLRCQIKPPNE